MDFDYDHARSVANKTKQGISFDEAQAIWNNLAYLEIPA
jgi:uncharacterized protein